MTRMMVNNEYRQANIPEDEMAYFDRIQLEELPSCRTVSFAHTACTTGRNSMNQLNLKSIFVQHKCQVLKCSRRSESTAVGFKSKLSPSCFVLDRSAYRYCDRNHFDTSSMYQTWQI